MKTAQPLSTMDAVSREKVIALVRDMLGGDSSNPNPDDTPHPGPWDPYIRRALGRMRQYVQPQPQPWNEVMLNPQPLPPRISFLVGLTQEILDRTELIQEVANTMVPRGQQQGLMAGGFATRFVDEFCGTGFRIRLPIPKPYPHWFREELSGLDLIVMGAQFTQEASTIADERLQQEIRHAAEKLTQTGMARM